jgi:hypothetical protein
MQLSKAIQFTIQSITQLSTSLDFYLLIVKSFVG